MIEMIFKKEDLSSKFVRKYLLQGELMPNNRLVLGKMEAVIFFYEYSRFIKNTLFEEFADALMEDLCQDISDIDNISFYNGLSGIAWGFIYLHYRKFIAIDDLNLFLFDIDQIIMQRDSRRFTDISFDTGLGGVLYYIAIRISYAFTQHSLRPFDEIYIKELKYSLQNNKHYKQIRSDLQTLFFNSLNENNDINFNIGINCLSFMY